MIFKIKQTVTHPQREKAIEKVCHIMGYDLKHAISSINCPAQMKRELAKKFRSERTDVLGRKLVIEIIQEGIN